MSLRRQYHRLLIVPLLVAGSTLAISTQRVKREARPVAPCEGGILNSKVLMVSKPAYPQRAKRAKAEGKVVVRVRIDEEGKVYEAIACVGHSLLRRAAEDAAYRTRFSPTVLSGKAVKVAGVLVYVFKLDEEGGALYRP